MSPAIDTAAPFPTARTIRAGAAGPVASVVAAAAVLSSSYTLTKVALREVPPLTVGLVRFTVAAAVLAVWVRLTRGHEAPTRADRLRLALGGLLGITCYFSIENVGVDLATPTDAALLVACYPALTVCVESLVHRRLPRRGTVFGIGLALVGVTIIVGYSPGTHSARLVGDVMLILSGLVWALYSFCTRDVASRYTTSTVIYHQTTAGALGFVPLAALEIPRWRVPAGPGATLTSLAALALGCSLVGLVLYARGLRRLQPSTAVNLLNLVPVFGLGIALLVLHERPSAAQVLGGLIVIAGVTQSTRNDHSLDDPQGARTPS
ncbi:DMT family transporter [Monashia sp. NPDC004114]